MTTVSKPARTSKPKRGAQRKRVGDSGRTGGSSRWRLRDRSVPPLPLQQGLRAAARIYFRRLLVLVSVAASLLALIVLTAYRGPVSAITVIVFVSIILVLMSLTSRRRREPGKARARSRRFVALFLVLLPGLTIISALLFLDSRGKRLDFAILAIAASVGVALVGLVQTQIAVMATKERVEEFQLAVAIERAYQPLTTILGDLVSARSPKDRDAATRVLIDKAVGLVKVMTGRAGGVLSRTRSMYYRFDGPNRLVLDTFEGDYGSPRQDFVAERSENDSRVIELAKSETALFVNDLDVAPPAYFDRPSDRPYKSLICVPVRAGDRQFGILMIDAEYANSLTDVDVRYAISIAGLLGAGLAAADTSVNQSSGYTPDIAYIDEFAERVDVSFAHPAEAAGMAFELVPEADRRLLANGISPQSYYSSIASLAERRAEQQLDTPPPSIRNLPRAIWTWTKDKGQPNDSYIAPQSAAG